MCTDSSESNGRCLYQTEQTDALNMIHTLTVQGTDCQKCHSEMKGSILLLDKSSIWKTNNMHLVCKFTYQCTHVYSHTNTHKLIHRTVGNMICSAMGWWGKVRPSCNQKKQWATIKAVLKQSLAWGMDPCVGTRKRKCTLSCVSQREYNRIK